MWGRPGSLWLGLSLARLAIDRVIREMLAPDLTDHLDSLQALVGSPRRLMAWVDEDVERPFVILDSVDRQLGQKGLACVFTFDALDRAANDWGTLEVVVGGLLSLALDVQRRNRSLRLKVFLRPDLELGGARRFPDASKLRGYREELVWSKQDLYRLVLKRMISQQEGGAESFIFLTNLVGSEQFQEIEPLGSTPMTTLDEGDQERVMTALVGKYMGANPRKGLTYTLVDTKSLSRRYGARLSSVFSSGFCSGGSLD